MIASLGPHWGFIVASYVVFAVVVAGMVAWIRLDGKAQHRALADLEARGVRRRSDPVPAPTPTGDMAKEPSA
jgi:heme exporter protein D